MGKCGKGIAQFEKLAKRLLMLADKLDCRCITQDEKDALAVIYQEFIAEFMK